MFKNNYFIQPDQNLFPIKQFAFDKFGQYPFSASFDDDYELDIINYFDENFIKINESYSFSRNDESHTKNICYENKNIVLRVWLREKGDRLYLTIQNFFSNDGKYILQFKNEIDKYIIPDEEKSNLYVITQNNSGLFLKSLNFKKDPVSIEDNYNDDFFEVYKKMTSELSEKDSKGLYLWSSDPGCGKSKCLSKLATDVKNKKVIFLPPNMTEVISSPSFIPFLFEYNSSIIIIEDAEDVLSSRDNNTTRTLATSNLLNLTSGLLADCLQINIIATINRREKIDEALLRKGRLKLDYTFKSLSTEKSNKLLKKLGKTFETLEPMTLADIYNCDYSNNHEYNSKKKIGF